MSVHPPIADMARHPANCSDVPVSDSCAATKLGWSSRLLVRHAALSCRRTQFYPLRAQTGGARSTYPCASADRYLVNPSNGVSSPLGRLLGRSPQARRESSPLCLGHGGAVCRNPQRRAPPFLATPFSVLVIYEQQFLDPPPLGGSAHDFAPFAMTARSISAGVRTVAGSSIVGGLSPADHPRQHHQDVARAVADGIGAAVGTTVGESAIHPDPVVRSRVGAKIVATG